MFKKLFSAKADASPDPTPGPQLGMLALRSGKGLSPSRVIAEWARLFPNQPSLTEEPSEDGKKGVATFDSGGRSITFAAMPAPIPQAEIDDAADRSWMWPEAKEQMRQQKAHAIAVTTPLDEPIAEAWAVTRLLAAAASAGDAAGIYWGSGSVVHKPESFIGLAKSCGEEEDMLPVMLWIGTVISADSAKGPYTLTTCGMRPFGHKELEIINTRMPPSELIPTVSDWMNYLLLSGPIFKHGQTCGPTPKDKWKIEHVASEFREGEGVIRIRVP